MLMECKQVDVEDDHDLIFEPFLHMVVPPSPCVCFMFCCVPSRQQQTSLRLFSFEEFFRQEIFIFQKNKNLTEMERRERDGAIKSFSILALLFSFLSFSIYLQKSSST